MRLFSLYVKQIQRFSAKNDDKCVYPIPTVCQIFDARTTWQEGGKQGLDSPAKFTKEICETAEGNTRYFLQNFVTTIFEKYFFFTFRILSRILAKYEIKKPNSSCEKCHNHGKLKKKNYP